MKVIDHTHPQGPHLLLSGLYRSLVQIGAGDQTKQVQIQGTLAQSWWPTSLGGRWMEYPGHGNTKKTSSCQSIEEKFRHDVTISSILLRLRSERPPLPPTPEKPASSIWCHGGVRNTRGIVGYSSSSRRQEISAPVLALNFTPGCMGASCPFARSE